MAPHRAAPGSCGPGACRREPGGRQGDQSLSHAVFTLEKISLGKAFPLQSLASVSARHLQPGALWPRAPGPAHLSDGCLLPGRDRPAAGLWLQELTPEGPGLDTEYLLCLSRKAAAGLGKRKVKISERETGDREEAKVFLSKTQRGEK